jgi:hypothetical protein
VEEVEKALKLIPGRRELLTVEGAGHDLGFKGKARVEETPHRIVTAFIAMVTEQEADPSLRSG